MKVILFFIIQRIKQLFLIITLFYWSSIILFATWYFIWITKTDFHIQKCARPRNFHVHAHCFRNMRMPMHVAQSLSFQKGSKMTSASQFVFFLLLPFGVAASGSIGFVVGYSLDLSSVRCFCLLFLVARRSLPPVKNDGALFSWDFPSMHQDCPIYSGSTVMAFSN